MQRLWSKNKVYKRRSLTDFGAFLTGNATAYTNNQIRISLFKMLPAAQLMEDFFLGFFSNRAGV